jgi:hypothetical protein
MEEKKRSVVLQEARIGLAEERRNDWVVNAEEGTTIQDVLDPAYWAFTSNKLTPYDHIEVRLETGEWIADLVVLQVGMSFTRVHLRHFYDLVQVKEDLPVPQKHEVVWRGPQHKFAVKRLQDQQVLQNGFNTREEAGVWLKNHEQVVANT